MRAYDVLSNSFSLNQAGVIFERAPKVEEGRRFGARLDLMFGQATETLQGSAVNGINQSEDFNGWKSQAVLLTFKPTSRITAQTNYYAGREQRVRTSILNPTFPVLPTQPGLSPVEIRPRPDGRFHIHDSYATFNVTDWLTFAFDGDYVINRSFKDFPLSI